MCGGPLVGDRLGRRTAEEVDRRFRTLVDCFMSLSSSNPEMPKPGPARGYTVVARRYRPQTFDELIGQDHVGKALSGAITTNRVGHAYLFTGARGVGKTSAARILAKALDCETGPVPVPCNRCEICRSISSGDDVDVLEIDGASNRGIDEIRQLRQNVNVRPSRARFKIYIIDEVHMLTREAFNALLKTLEEPPQHVKFIFCTTEPSKIPITILSRCQRFDFAGIQAGSIAERLRQIVEAEDVSAEPEALETLARRATGSMRDAQSLLEQLLAFAPERITLGDVHAMLGTANDQRLHDLAAHLVRHDAAGALAEFRAALDGGVDAAQLIEQLFGYFRDCMAAAVGCSAETMLYASPAKREEVMATGKQIGLQTLLAAMQILDQTLSRMRLSTQSRILGELALVRICSLEDLDELPALIAQLRSGAPAVGSPGAGSAVAQPRVSAATDRRGEPHPPAVPSPQSGPNAPTGDKGDKKRELTPENAAEIWSQAAAKLSGLAADNANHFDHVAISAPNRLVIYFKPRYTLAKSVCEHPDQVARFERALAELTGQRIGLEFALLESEPSEPSEDRRGAVLPRQRIREVAQHPLIRQAGELFGAQPTRVDDPPTDQ